MLCHHSPSASTRTLQQKGQDIQQRSLQPLASWGILSVTMENALVESKTAQPKLIPLSWCPLRAADDPWGVELFESCGLHQRVAAHHPSQMHTEPMFSFFFLVEVTKGAVPTFLYYCTPTFLYYFTAPVLQTRIAPVHQISPLHNTADTVVHGVIFNTSHVLREEICKRFEAKRFRQVMYLKGVLQQGVPMHSSTKRSQPPSSNNCLVQVVEAKAKRVCDLEQTPKTPDSSPCKPQSQQAVRLTHTQDSLVTFSCGLLPFMSPYTVIFYTSPSKQNDSLCCLSCFCPSQLHSIQENHFFQPVLYLSLL